MAEKNDSSGRRILDGVLTSANFLSMQYRIPTIALDEFEIGAEIIALVPKELCSTHRVLPVSRAASALVVAMVDPIDEAAIDALKSHTGYTIEPVITTEAVLVEAITKYYG
jgi:type IV pilus assembly protein PilB